MSGHFSNLIFASHAILNVDHRWEVNLALASSIIPEISFFVVPLFFSITSPHVGII
jgi:hypothetical protein